ncbi:hypothetical protein [Aquiflexum sp.]|uniref:hypothetical protein n=1 Tax=Aquiflexum sp. TaxID=1872584 RepID=UPI003592EC02
MKRLSQNYIIVFLFFSLSCSTGRDKEAVSLIEKSIEAHGGQLAWDRLQVFSMEKESWLYYEDGQIETQSLQQNEFRLKPYFEARMSWEKDSIIHKVIFDGIRTQYLMGENEILNEGFLRSKKKDIDAAYYVITKPFDLLDEGKNLKYMGLTKLPDGREVETVQVIDGDPDNPQTDIWWYYFDPESYRIVAYKAKTSDHFSLVYNVEWDDATGILFPSKRESYRVDSLGNLLYLRAEYTYRNYR